MSEKELWRQIDALGRMVRDLQTREGHTFTILQTLLDGASGGVFIGTDTQFYRSAANVIRTPDSLTVDGAVNAAGGNAIQRSWMGV